MMRTGSRRFVRQVFQSVLDGSHPPVRQGNVQLGAGTEADNELNPLSPREVPQ